MHWSDYLTDRLDKLIAAPSRSVTVSAYRFALDERQIFTTDNSYRRLASGQLVLIWEDGSVSCHRISPPLAVDEQLPVDRWRRSRFFRHDKRYFAKADRPCPNVCLYDEAVAAAVRMESSPDLPAGFGAELLLQKWTVAHSKGLLQQADLTEATLFPLRHSYPFGYRSRKLPDESETAYLETESLWWEKQPVKPFSLLSWNKSNTVVLLSPDAFRQLLQSGLLAHLEQPDTQRIATSFIQSISADTSLALRHDPLIPWSPGSFRFCDEGFAARVLSLPELAEQKMTSVSAKSLHWQHTHVLRMREWLPSQQSVLYIGRFHLPDLFHPQQTITAWAHQAVLFQEGGACAAGASLLRFSLADLLTCADLQLVSKVGWDGCGIAFPPAVWLRLPE